MSDPEEPNGESGYPDSESGSPASESGSRWKLAWSGGQYSLLRIVLAGGIGVALVLSFFFDRASLLSIVLAAISFAVAAGVGTGGRVLAALLAAGLLYSNEQFFGPEARGLAALWLVAHALMRPAPYGSVGAMGRSDPGGGWKMRAWYPAFTTVLFVVVRATEAVGAASAGHLALAFFLALVALFFVFSRTSMLAWSLSLGLGLAVGAGGLHSLAAELMLHLLALQPAWIPPRRRDERGTVFYDGTCALCHHAVRFLLAEDRAARLRIAPLGSETFVSQVDEAARTQLPDSVVLVRGHRVLARSTAVIEMLDDLGGFWRILADVMRVVPEPVRDRAYDAVASRRYRWFGRKADACPLMPPELRTRIEI